MKKSESNTQTRLAAGFAGQTGFMAMMKKMTYRILLLLMVTCCDCVFELFDLIGGVEVSGSQDEQFAGRVHWDKDVLKEGRLRLQMSSLRTEDSGLYVCEMITNNSRGAGSIHLNVTAAAHEPQTQRPTVRPGAKSRGRPGLYAGLVMGLLLVLTASAGLFLYVFKKVGVKPPPPTTTTTVQPYNHPVDFYE